MNKQQALKKLETMTNQEFNQFLESLPARVQLLVKSNFVDWKETLPDWYLKLN